MIYRFGDCSLDIESLELYRNGELIAVEPQVFSVLAFLIENRDRVVSKDELIDAVWDGRAISDGALNSRINLARRAVGDNGETQAIIKTFPRRGFRFVASLAADDSLASEADIQVSLNGKRSIAVMPFTNISNDPEQEFFADGITQDLITALSRIRRFQIIARGSTFSFKGQPYDIRQVARELDATYIIEGSARKAGDRIRVTAQLVAGDSGKQVWAERYDKGTEDIFALQDDLVLAIIGAVEPAMARSEQEHAQRKHPDSLDAWESYQRGKSHFHRRTDNDVAIARDLFQRAIQIDPQFVLGHTGIAQLSIWRQLLGFAPEDRELAEKSARRAIELDPDEPEGHMSLGIVLYANSDMENSILALETALHLNPSYAAAYHHLATALTHIGRPHDAVPHLLTAIRLSPKDPDLAMFHARLALAHLYLRNHDDSVDWGRKALRLPAVQWPAFCFLIASLAHLERMDEAKAVVEQLQSFRPGITMDYICDHYPSVVKENFDHLIDGLQKAGVPMK